MGMRSARAPSGLAALIVAFVLTTGAVEAKSYSADRFDSTVVVQPDGTLEVTETVLFRFESGTFREVFREIPLRRTDGIEVIDAELDSRPLPRGREVGTIEVDERRTRVRVVWRFPPVQETTAAFTLRYRVRGAVRQEPGADRLDWRSTPTEHRYLIRDSTVTFELPLSPAAPPEVRVRRADSPLVVAEGSTVAVTTGNIRRNGWVETSVAFPPASVAHTPPTWQQRALRIQAQSSRWIATAASILGVGLVLLLLMRPGYNRPPGDAGAGAHQSYPPDGLDPALGGVLVSNGQPALHHAVATLFSLAERGELEIRERRGRFGIREFVLTRRAGSAALRGHEREALAIVFKGHPQAGRTATLAEARSRLTWQMRRFAAAVRQDLAAERLIDADREAVRTRYTRAGIGLLVTAGLAGIIAAALLVPEHGPWPLTLVAALLILGLAAFILGAAVTPLSNDGVRRASRWHAYRRHLSDIAAGRHPAPPADPLLPFAVALGLAAAWAKYLKQQGHPVPAWFQSTTPEAAYAAFPALIAAGSGSGGAGGGGGAAGGGASGAG